MRKFFELAVISLFLVMTNCTQPDTAARVLENDGYTDIEITGYEVFMCGEDDDFSTGFVAKKNGKVIEGAVCSGFLKGNTIRLE